MSVDPLLPSRVDAMDALIKNDRGTQKYDALLLLSGGKDSAYILYRMRTEYPALRVLCLLVNNGFMSDDAISSAQLAADKLHADMLVVNASVPDFARVFREAFLKLKNGKGSYGIVDYADGQLIFDVGKRFARDFSIPMMIAGLSWVQLAKIFGIHDFLQIEPDGLKLLFPLAAWQTDEGVVQKFVREKGLLVQGSDSPVVSNNRLILTMCAADVLNLGYCSFEPEFAQLIREGKTDRKTWLYRFELLEFAATRGYLRAEMQDALLSLRLSISDIVRSM